MTTKFPRHHGPESARSWKKAVRGDRHARPEYDMRGGSVPRVLVRQAALSEDGLNTLRFMVRGGDATELGRTCATSNMRVRFGELREQAVSGSWQNWADVRGCAWSLILLLDQFRANMFPRAACAPFAYGRPGARTHALGHAGQPMGRRAPYDRRGISGSTLHVAATRRASEVRKTSVAA